MRILANENFPGEAIRKLKEHGHDVKWIRIESPGISDNEVLDIARKENRILITFDKDFGELAFKSKLPAECGIILFRISTSSPEYITKVAIAVLESRSDWAGNFSVIEDNRIRITPLPQE